LFYGTDDQLKMENEKVIIVKDLTKRFGGFTAVDKITFDVEKGEIFGFLGANGAGKTTAMRMLCGLLLPTSGLATVAGFDVYKQNEQIKKNIGYMSQKFSLYEDLTISENIRFYAGIYGLSDGRIKEKTGLLIKQLHFLYRDCARPGYCFFGRAYRRRRPGNQEGVLGADLRSVGKMYYHFCNHPLYGRSGVL
jgi:ABC-type Na+ transport system ATPase subunit NatA